MDIGKNSTEKIFVVAIVIQFFPEHVKLESYGVLIFYIFTTVETQISAPLELVIKNRIIFLREGGG